MNLPNGNKIIMTCGYLLLTANVISAAINIFKHDWIWVGLNTSAVGWMIYIIRELHKENRRNNEKDNNLE